MIAFVISLVVLVGVVAGLNLLLTVGVIRRLKLHTSQLANLPKMDGSNESLMIAEGERIGEFETVTSDGEAVSRDSLSGQTLVGVLSPSCSACEERLPEFVETAKAFPGGRGQVLAVIAGQPDEVAGYLQKLAPVARVVVEPPIDGPLGSALKVQGFPTFALLDGEGTVVAGGISPKQLPMPAAA
ncbi:TlpA disulfide reductase family protein [Hamadaea sp. NPDC050747]|uniref:TlpA family protein disulfide reductase n=1 Tax=Hamadaea sp. NPDC050747 TaxID=3155789 RepID=UPI0033E4C40C